MGSNCKQETGASLLELIIGLVFLSILIGGGSLLISGLTKKESEVQHSKSILTLFEQAAVTALRSQQTVKIVKTGDLLKENTKGRLVKLHKDFKYSLKFGSSSTLISFYPSGSASAGTLQITGPDLICTILQTVSGARRLECSDAS